MRILAFWLAFLLMPSAGHAMAFRLFGSTLVMSGPVAGEDLARFKDQMATGQVKRVVLHESPGGDLWSGQRLAHEIRDAGLPTAVSGKCQSSCGLIFLGGVERSFSDGRPLAESMVSLHGAHHAQSKLLMPEMGARMAYLIQTLTSEHFPRALLERIAYPKHPDNAVFVFHPQRFAGKPQGVMECLRQDDGTFNCRMNEAMDAVSTGVITRTEITLLEAEVKDYLSRP